LPGEELVGVFTSAMNAEATKANCIASRGKYDTDNYWIVEAPVDQPPARPTASFTISRDDLYRKITW